MKKWIVTAFAMFCLILVMPMNADAKNCADGKHVWGAWEVDKEATFKNTGIKSRECTVKGCSAYEKKVIPVKTMNSKQNAVYKEFKKYIKYAKSYNVTKLSKCFKDPSKAKSKFFGWSYLINRAKKYNTKYLKYEVISIKVNGKKATLKAKITGPSIYSTVMFACDDLMKYVIKHPNYSQSKYNSYYKKRIKYWFKDIGLYNDTDKRTVTFNYVKTGGSWKIKSPTTSIVDVASMRYNYSGNKYLS